MQTFFEGVEVRLVEFGGGGVQDGDAPNLCLRERGTRPASRSGENELPPSHSITSSARPRKVGGISRLMAFAVATLITSSNFVGCATGNVAGSAPLRILSTYSAA